MSEETVVKMLFGSHVYGTNVPGSDLDYKRVFLPSARDILLQRATKTSRTSSTGDPKGKNAAGDIDLEEFSLHGYMKLLCDGQTVAMDMLFVPPEHEVEASDTWLTIQNNRHRFVSRNVGPFVGYCRAQANKYGIKGSRMAAAKAAAETLRKAANSSRLPSDVRVGGLWHGILDALINDHPDHIGIEWKKHRGQDRQEAYLFVCGKLAPFTLRVDRAAEMYEALFARYGQRTRDAMNNENIDWKALMHAVRVCDQATELLDTGEITFPRPNADALIRIRLGERTYASVAEQIEEGMARLEEAMEASSLASEPDRKFAEELVVAEYGGLISQAFEYGQIPSAWAVTRDRS